MYELTPDNAILTLKLMPNDCSHTTPIRTPTILVSLMGKDIFKFDLPITSDLFKAHT